jgi:hypothetical protein
MQNDFEQIEKDFKYFPYLLLKGQCHGIFCFRFFLQAPEKHLSIIFEFFQKFAEIFASQGELPVSTTPTVAWRKLIHEKNLESKIS